MFERLPPSKRFFSYIVLFITGLFFMFSIISGGMSNLNMKKYVVYFDRSVSGLQVGNSVYFKGVPIGLIDAIKVEQSDISRVRVVIKLDKNIKLNQGCRAKLGLQGLTGNSILEINQNEGSKASKYGLLEGAMPEIISEASSIEKLFDDAPSLMCNANKALQNIDGILNTNKKNISTLIANASDAFAAVTRCAERFEKNMLPSMEAASESLLQFIEMINNLNNITGVFSDSISQRNGFLSYIIGV